MGLDTFFGMDDADGSMSPDKVREFQERMARNARQMAAARKQEGKQKKKEGKLVAILLKFIRNNKKGDITLLVSRCLEQNIPAVIILAIILLGNPEVQEEVGIRLQLTEGEEKKRKSDSFDSNGESDGPTSLAEMEDEEIKGAMVILGQDTTLPIKMRIAIDLWAKGIWEAIEPIPEKIFKTAIDFSDDPKADPIPKAVLIQLTAFILRDYFESNKFDQKFENTKGFATFLIKGLFKRLKEQTEDQKQIDGDEG